MPGASANTRRITFVNLNWDASAGDGTAVVEALVVTEDERRHPIAINSAELGGFVAMVTACPVLLFDPDDQTIIAANLVGEWLPTDWSGLDPSPGSTSG